MFRVDRQTNLETTLNLKL